MAISNHSRYFALIMKAIIINEFGGVDKLIQVELPIPTIGENEVLIQTKAIGINPVDVRTRAGSAMAPYLEKHMPLILGWDVSGIVLKIGENVKDLNVGDEVFGLINFLGHGKGYAKYVAAPADQLAIKPANITFSEAAALPLAGLTAWQTLNYYAKIKKGDRVLIQAASGGVGHLAVQIAKILGAEVYGVSSSKNRDFILGQGADKHIAYDECQFDEVINDMDVVLDAFAFDSLKHSLNATRTGGKIISLLPMISNEILQMAKAKNVEIHYSLVSSNGEDMKKLAEFIKSGLLRPFVSQQFKFEEMELAHKAMETSKTVGKIVVTL